ncbi:DUF7619 domain-containing protein [Psychroserpens sp. MEBiC05023]
MKKTLPLIFLIFSTFIYAQTTLTMQDGFFEVCGGTFSDSGGSTPYGSNENFTLTICPETNGDFVKLTFNSFLTEYENDVLTVYNGDSTDAPIEGVYSGTTATIIINAYNPSGCLTLNFVSDEDDEASGWFADISCVSTFLMNQPTDYELCGFNNETVAEFDLDSKTPEILGSLDPNNYQVTYHSSLSEAEENVNSLTSPYTNVTYPTDLIFVRVTELSSGLYNIANFHVKVNGVDVNGVSVEIIVCDEGEPDGFSTFDLTQFDNELTMGNPNLSVSYFETFDDALTDLNVIVNPTSYVNTNPYFQTVVPRIVDNTNGCFFVSGNTAVYLNVQSSFDINEPTPYIVCDDNDDGVFVFDLNTKTSEILNGQDNPTIIVSYHESQFDADVNVNPLNPIYTNVQPFAQTIYVRVSSISGDCFQTTTLDLIVETTCVSASSVDAFVCGDSPNIPVDYDLTSNESDLVNGQNTSGFNFEYYLTLQDAQNQSNSIANPQVYEVSGNSSVVYVRIEDITTMDNIIVEIYVNFVLNPQISFNDSYAICSGQEIIVTPFISNANVNSLNYLWNTGSTESEIIVIEPGIYSVTVTDTITGCSSFGETLVDEGESPVTNQPEHIISCDTTVGFDLTSIYAELLGSQDPTNFNISFHLTSNDAFNQVNAITVPEDYVPSSNNETIYVVVQNIGDACFSIESFQIITENCPIEVICGNEPVNTSYCYDINDATPYVYMSNDDSQLQVVFNAGQVELGWDELVVLDSDGVTNINPETTTYGNNGDLTGLSFTSSGSSITVFIDSDDIISCATQNYIPLDYNVSCIDPNALPGCTSILLTPENEAIDVNENTDLSWSPSTGVVTGYKLSLGITPGGTEVLNNIDVGDVLSYEIDTLDFEVTYYLTIVAYNNNGDAENCTEQSFTTRANPFQIVACENGAINTTYCYGNNDTSEFAFESDNGLPLTLVFNTGATEVNFDQITIVDSDGTILNPNLPYGNNGSFAGLTYTSTGSNISVLFNSDGSISCQSGSSCCTEQFDFDVFCSSSVGFIQVNAFVDTNVNSVFDSNEPNFNNGYFTYELNNDGNINTVNSSTGSFQIISANATDSYDITFNLYEESAGCYDVSIPVFNDVSVAIGNTIIIDFPVVEEQNCEDLALYLLNYWTPPRPGFSHENHLILENLGFTTIASGSVEFTIDPQLVFNGIGSINPNYTVTPTGTGFILDFVNLEPGSQEDIEIYLTCPASVTLDDIVTNSAVYITDTNDLVVSNNYSTLSEIVVGSWDPNDKMEAHGPQIKYDDFITSDEYLYYTIRFQNLGTAAATFIRIDDVLDNQLDETSFQMLRSSHDYVVTRTDNNLEWFFEDINLPAEQDDELGSQGYVYFRIKPKVGYAIGDVIPNTAAIYFDFNAPVITNRFDSEFVEESLSITETSFTSFDMFPNPAKEQITIVMNDVSFESTEISIMDLQGKLIVNHNISGDNRLEVDISSLHSGLYFVKVTVNTASVVKKLVIE